MFVFILSSLCPKLSPGFTIFQYLRQEAELKEAENVKVLSSQLLEGYQWGKHK